MSDLKVWTNGIEWYVARDMAHLAEVYRATTCMDLTDEDALGDDGEWSECRAAETLTILCDADGHPSDAGESVTRTMAEWAEREGPGMLASEEY